MMVQKKKNSDDAILKHILDVCTRGIILHSFSGFYEYNGPNDTFMVSILFRATLLFSKS